MGERKFSTKNRFVSFLLAIAMVLTLLPIGAVQAKAEEAAVKLYFELPDGTTVTDWGVNVWTDAKVSNGDTEHAFRPSTWGTTGDKYPTLLADQTNKGWGYVEISGTIDGLQFVNKEGKEYKCWNAQIANEGYKEAYFDPSVGKWYTSAEKTTEIKAAEIKNTFTLAGDSGLTGNSSWDAKDERNVLVQDGSDTNKFSITFRDVAKGTYSYKILQDPETCGWDKPWGYGTGSDGNRSVTIEAPSDVTFTIDLTDTSEGKNVKVEQKKLQKIVVENGNISKGQTKELSTSAEYYDGTSADVKTVTVSYQLKSPMEGVTLDGNKLTVAKDVNSTEVIVIASHGDFTQELTIPVVEKQYQVTINMYSQDLEMKPGVSDIYIFENGGSNNTTVTLNKTVEDTENNVTWVQGTVTVPYNSLGIIARDQAGSWDGGKDGDRLYTIDENTSEVTLWYVYGKTPVTEKPTITKEDPRYFYLEYENDTLTTTPEFYSWTTGFASELKKFESAGAGKWKIKVPVKSSCTKVDFVVVLDPSGSDWILPALTGSRMEEITPLHFHKSRTLYAQA